LRAYAVERRLRGGDGLIVPAGPIGRRFILLAGGVGLGFGGLLLGARFFECAAGDVAGRDQAGIALGIGRGELRLRLRGLVVGERGGDFGYFGGIELAFTP